MKAALPLITTLALTLCLAPAGWAQTWPADEQWRVLECGEVPSFDPLGDEPAANDERDVVGDAAHPALYIAMDDDYLFFRMRLDQDPTQGNALRPFGWAVELDTDGDPLGYELLVQVDGIANPEVVTLGRNTDQRTPDDPADPIEEVIASYPASTFARAVQAAGSFDSAFGGDPDFFIDWAVPWTDLSEDGVTAESELALVMGTSSSASAIDADLACNDGSLGLDSLSDTATDPARPDGRPPADSDGDGLTDLEEVRLGTDPALADSDGDGYTDGVEVREATDPLDAESHPAVGPDGGPDGGPALDAGGLTLRGGPAGCSVSGAPDLALPLLLALLGLSASRRMMRR